MVISRSFITFITILNIMGISLYSQEKSKFDQLKKSAPRVFIDCEYCDIEYIKTEIPFVNYVRDRMEAQVHVLITTQGTGGGGVEYTITFMGQKEFEGMENVLKFVSKRTDTEEEIREGLVKTLKIGLVPYVAKTPISELLNISMEEKVEPTAVEDKWNFWVFSLSTHTFLNGEKLRNSYSLWGNFSASRVTPELKVRLGISNSLSKDSFIVDDEEIKSYSRSGSFSGMIVKSINEHWSIGGWLNIRSSTYDNIKLSVSPAPAIEFNVFPYSQSTRRQLRILYLLGFISAKYREETIYDKTYERLLKEALSVTLELKEKWGSISTTLEGSHFFHDFNKNRLEIFTDISLRIVKGLSLNIFGSYSRIHDQLSLPKAGASLEEVLLRRRMLETTYDYWASIGLSYTFGSIYSNVVNPRFGDTGSRTIIIR